MKIGIIGLDAFGYHAAIQLAEKGIDVLVIDKDSNKIEDIRNRVTQAIHVNITNEESLRNIGIEEMDTILISIGDDFEQTAMLTRISKHNLNIRYVIARTNFETKKEILELIGADQVIMPEYESAIYFANQICSPFPHSMCLSEEVSIIDIVAPKEFLNKTAEEIDFENNYSCKLIGIKRNDKIQMDMDEKIEENDILYIAGKNKHLKNIFEL